MNKLEQKYLDEINLQCRKKRVKDLANLLRKKISSALKFAETKEELDMVYKEFDEALEALIHY